MVLSPAAGYLLWSVEPVEAEPDVLGIGGADFEDACHAGNLKVPVKWMEGLGQRLGARDDGVLVYGVFFSSY